MSSEALTHMLQGVIGREPFESAFRDAFQKFNSESPTLRRQARHEWMAFMRDHIAAYLVLCPDACEELLPDMEGIVARGRGGQTYQANARHVLAVVRAFHALGPS